MITYSADSYKKEDYREKVHPIRGRAPWIEGCFGCNGGPNEGVGIRIYYTEDGYAVAPLHTKPCHQGYPEVVHGGIVATYFDEVLWRGVTQHYTETAVMTAEISVKYIKPVPTDTDIMLISFLTGQERRHYYSAGYLLLPDHSMAAEATGHYIALKKGAQVDEAHKGDVRNEFTDGRTEFVF